MNPPESQGTIVWRVGTVEQAIRDERASRQAAMEKLDREKADAKDVARLADEFGSLRRTLQWFMGVVATAVIAFAGIVVTLAGH